MAIAEHYPETELTSLQQRGTGILGVLLPIDVARIVEGAELIDAVTAIPIHDNGEDVFTSPRSDFERAIRNPELEDRVASLEHGEAFECEASDRRMEENEENRRMR